MQVVRLRWPGRGKQHPLPVWREDFRTEGVQSGFRAQRFSLAGLHIVEKNAPIAVDVAFVGDEPAAEFAGVAIPGLPGDPIDGSGPDIEQPHVRVAIQRARGDQKTATIGRPIRGMIVVLALLRADSPNGPGSQLHHENNVHLLVRAVARESERAPVRRPHRVMIAEFLRRVFGNLTNPTAGEIHNVDFVARAGLRFGHIGQPLPIRRPAWRFFGNFRRAREIAHLPGFGGDGEQVPLLIAVVVGLKGDPLAVGRPAAGNLALFGDGQLQRPPAARIDDPDILPSAGVRGEADPPAVGRPAPGTDATGVI